MQISESGLARYLVPGCIGRAYLITGFDGGIYCRGASNNLIHPASGEGGTIAGSAAELQKLEECPITSCLRHRRHSRKDYCTVTAPWRR